MKSKLTPTQPIHLLASAIFIVILLANFNASAQTGDSLIVDDGINSKSFVESVKNAEVKNSMEVKNSAKIKFIETFEIDENNRKNAKILEDVLLLREPDANSESLQILIPKGAKVKTYRYFAREGYWAIKYKDNWGFVPLSKVMQVKEEKNTNSFTPYDTPPKLRTSLSLKYPESARIANIQGDVVFSILVDKTGKVKEYHLIKSIPELNAAAIEAISKLKFKSGKYQGKPVEVWMRFPVSFRIKQ
ncbi:MAG: hypothetical protein B6D61_12090 [Bacteroidetes bacterium 4484_249]|nr:MAG: hypothetical protein B6D61_12090 [Bacteroidetes bacterium 4484_249]